MSVKSIIIDGVEYRPVTKNSPRVAELIRLSQEIDNLGLDFPSVMVHGFKSDEFSLEDWTLTDCRGSKSFHFTKNPSLVCFTDDPFESEAQ